MYRKIAGKIIVLFAVLVCLFAALSPVFIYKTPHRAKLVQGLYDSGDEYDVLLIGSSHMNGGLDPNVLWKQYGITSFNYATGGQTLDVSYYLLREALKKHHPDVVAVDTFYSAMTSPYGESGLVSNALDNMKWSANKVQATFHCVPPQEWIFYFLPALKYHFRWSTLDPKDYSYFDMSSYYYMKGYMSGTNRWGKSDASYVSTQKQAEIPQKSLQYLEKIIDLSREEGFSLIFLNFPADYSEYDAKNGWVDDCEALFNSVASYAEKKGVPFLDYCDKMDEIGLDFPNDMNNATHLNQWGACKLSSDFGSYLKEHYHLADHRSDPAYAQWDRDYLLSQAHDVLD